MSALEDAKKRNQQVHKDFAAAKDRRRVANQKLADDSLRRQREAEEKAKQKSKWSWLASAGKGALAGLLASGGNPIGALVGGIGGGVLDRVAGSAGAGLVDELSPMVAQGGQAYNMNQPQQRLLDQFDAGQQAMADAGETQFEDWGETGSNWDDPYRGGGYQTRGKFKMIG